MMALWGEPGGSARITAPRHCITALWPLSCRDFVEEMTPPGSARSSRGGSLQCPPTLLGLVAFQKTLPLGAVLAFLCPRRLVLLSCQSPGLITPLCFTGLLPAWGLPRGCVTAE